MRDENVDKENNKRSHLSFCCKLLSGCRNQLLYCTVQLRLFQLNRDPARNSSSLWVPVEGLSMA